MGKKAASKKRPLEEEEGERRSKSRHDKGAPTLASVSTRLGPLFRNSDNARAFREKFHARQILDGKFVQFDELQSMFENQNIDTAQHIASQGWIDFVKVKKPIYDNLVRILMSNLDARSMISWIGKKKIDLSVESWCRIFNIPNVTFEEEHFISTILKSDLFFRLTGETNLGVFPFIKTNQLHQEANVRLANQVVMNVLVPKKGSKEQIKFEEGKLLYALMYDSKINLASMIVERIRGVVGRKSSPICYPMHLVEFMERAGVNLASAGDEPRVCKSEINHHTLKRLGYKFSFGGWDFVGKGRVNVSFEEGQGERERGEEEVNRGEAAHEESSMPTQAESTAPSQPRTTQSSLHIQAQLANLASKNEIAHLRNFMAEQFQLLQATLLSKLDQMDARLQACEDHLNVHPPTATTSQIPPSDPKGKAPMTSPRASSPQASSPQTSRHAASSRQEHVGASSPTTSHHSQTQTIPPHPSPQPQTSQLSHSSHPSQSTTQFELVARSSQAKPQTSDSEATKSDSFLATPTPPIHPQHSSPQSAPAKFAQAYQRKKRSTTSG